MRRAFVVALVLLAPGLAGAQGKTAPPRPQATPAPPPVLEGVVRGPDGKPVADALVTAMAFVAVANTAPLSTRTDARGSFRLALTRAGLVNVRVEARGLAPQVLERTRPGTPLTVTLTRGGILTGVVRDGTAGTPVEGARVEAANFMHASLVPRWDTEAGAARAVTDAEGRFKLEGLGPGLQRVTASARGFDRAQRDGVRPGASVELFLFPGASIAGSVRDGQGKPVAGARVRVEATPRPRGRPEGRIEATDPRGRFEITGLKAGTYAVVARHDNFAPGLATVTLEATGEAAVDVVLPPASRLVGRLLGPNEQPVAGTVRLEELLGEPAPQALDDVLRAESGADGRFRLEGVPPGAHAFAAAARGLGSKRVEIDVREGNAETDAGDITLAAGLSIRGRVRDTAGAAIADAAIRAWVSFGPPQPEDRTQADGSFVLAGLTPGQYALNARAPGFGEASLSAEAGAEKVEIVLHAAGAVIGLVVDEADRPIEGFWVSRQSGDPNSVNSSESWESFADPGGRFQLNDLPPGKHTLEVSAPDRVAVPVSAVSVKPGLTTDVGRIRLAAGGLIRGLVVDTGGAPVIGATVRVRRGETEEGNAVSDGNGAFEVRGLSPGTKTLTARHPSYAQGRASGVDVDPARGPADARVVLSPGGRVEGIARRRDGSAIAGKVGVRPVPTGSGFGYGLDRDSMVAVGPEGSFAIDHVAPGRVMVVLMVETGRGLSSNRRVESEVRDGETTAVDLSIREILVSGRITRSAAPASNLQVTVRGEGGLLYTMSGPATGQGQAGPRMMAGQTREDGSFELLVDGPGPKRFSVATADGRTHLPVRRVEIPDVDSHVIDLAFNGVRVEGLAVDARTDQPIADAHVWPAGSASGSATSGRDGRFQLELEPGQYRLQGNAETYAPARVQVDVGGAGAADVRLAFSRGASLRGRVVDEGRRGLGSVDVTATPAAGAESGGAFTSTAADGSFEFQGLVAGRHNLVAAVSGLGFGVQLNVPTGEAEVVLTVRAGGMVALRILGPDGAPVVGASVSAPKLGGQPISGFGTGATSNAEGLVEFNAPAGALEVAASKEKQRGVVVVQVTPGATVTEVIRLASPTSQRAASQ